MGYTTALSRMSLLSYISLNTFWDKPLCTVVTVKKMDGEKLKLEPTWNFAPFLSQREKISHLKCCLAGFVLQIPGGILFHKNKLWDKCFNFHTLGISREKLFIRYFFKLLKSCWESTEIRSQLWTELYSWDHSLLPENPRSTPLEGSTSLLQ